MSYQVIPAGNPAHIELSGTVYFGMLSEVFLTSDIGVNVTTDGLTVVSDLVLIPAHKGNIYEDYLFAGNSEPFCVRLPGDNTVYHVQDKYRFKK